MDTFTTLNTKTEGTTIIFTKKKRYHNNNIHSPKYECSSASIANFESHLN